MKLTNLFIFAVLGSVSLLSSCKKDETTDSEATIETTVELSSNQATIDFMAQDANEVLMEAAEDNNLLGNFAPVQTHNFLQCATVTVTPQTGFPKTIQILFDSTCTNAHNIHRSGIIRIVISDSLRHSGSTAIMTFENYFVNGFQWEGTHTFTNTSPVNGKSWQYKIAQGKLIAPNGLFWLHHSIRDVVQTAGLNTPFNLFDDIISITGNGSITNAENNERTVTITQPLQKKYSCANIDKGRIRFEGQHHFAILDYGDGECDRVAQISVNGHAPRTILLP